MVPATTASWRAVATPVGQHDAAEVLRLARADYEVLLSPIKVDHPLDSNLSVTVPSRYCTGRLVPDALTPSGYRLDNWEVVKDRYVVLTNADFYSRAEAISNAFGQDARLDSCGVLDEGRKFFVVIATGTIEFIVSTGYDYIDNYVVAMTSHDGSIPICYYNLDVRRCNNAVYRFECGNANFSLRKRHTPNHGDNQVEISEVVALRRSWNTALQRAMTLLMVPLSDSDLEIVLNTEWDPDKVSTKSKREHVDHVHETVRSIYELDYNVGTYGKSKWSAFNALCEYIDFHRDIPIREAAQHSLEIDNYNHRMKVKLYEKLLHI